MLDQFPPSDHTPATGSSTGGLELVDAGPVDYNSQPDLVRGTLWTYENLAGKGEAPKDALVWGPGVCWDGPGVLRVPFLRDAAQGNGHKRKATSALA